MAEQNIRKTDPDKKYRRVMSASSLSADRVKNPEGEDLGKLDEIMIDVPTGRVAYAVVSFGGILGMGAKLFAIPWTSFTLDEDNKCFLLNVPKDRLKDAPGFDKDNWPDMADPTWRSGIYSYYGARPYWEEERTLRGGGGR